jgi:3-oxoacyl-(acyl-carrier-protein) synthase
MDGKGDRFNGERRGKRSLAAPMDYLRLNNFAFGGINTPLIFRRV